MRSLLHAWFAILRSPSRPSCSQPARALGCCVCTGARLSAAIPRPRGEGVQPLRRARVRRVIARPRQHAGADSQTHAAARWPGSWCALGVQMSTCLQQMHH
eukprot:814422-Pleurochrysis_carterae.AAC.2